VVGERVRQLAMADPDTWFAVERPNLLAAIHAACAGGQYRQGWRLAQCVAAYLHLNGYHDDAEQAWTAIAHAAGNAGDHVTTARARLRAAMVAAADKGHTTRASKSIQTCIAAFEMAGDLPGLALTHGLGAYCAQAESDHDQAREHAEAGAEAARQTGDTHGELICLCLLGVSLSELGDQARAIICCERALDVAHELDADYAGIVSDAFIQIRLAAGQFPQVIELCHQGLAAFPSAGQTSSCSYLYRHLGLAYQNLNNHAEAIEALTQAVEQFQESHNVYQEASCLRALADSYQATGRRDEAIHQLKKSIALFREHGYTRRESEGQTRLAAFNGKTYTA
jgi:tetratricopeptide (TPR) repeat protein